MNKNKRYACKLEYELVWMSFFEKIFSKIIFLKDLLKKRKVILYLDIKLIYFWM